MGNQITSLVTHLPDLQQSLFGLFSLTTTGKIPPTYDPIRPPSYPLAVRSPYLSAWIPGAYIPDLPSSSPQFWAGQNLSWSIIARVDGVTYNLFGVQHPGIGTRSASVKSAEYTSTHSIFTLDAGPGAFQLDFFSPVSPSNYLRQSLPFSYLTISASSANGSNIQVYSDIDNSWTGKSTGTTWNFNQSANTSVFSLSVENAYTYSQNLLQQALWGDTVFASRPSNSSTVSVEAGDRTVLRGNFANQGSLTGAVPAWTPGGVVGIAHDLGQVKEEKAVTFAIGYVREQAINYLGSPYTGYYRAEYPDNLSAVSYFLDDFQDAQNESLTVDSMIARKATEVAGTNYSDIVTLSLRQAYGGIDLVIPNDTLDSNVTMAFIKEISSDGNVNTVDVIMPAFPLYYIMDPEYIRLLLEPVVRYLATGAWKLPYVIHDIGKDYPNATGHDNQKAEMMPIEETGNLLILAYAYTVASGSKTWASEYMEMFQHYADYLVDNSIDIVKQLSTNDAAGPLANETNLAVKAAIGLKAFGALSGLKNYSDIGDDHAKLLYQDGLATDPEKTHFVLEYPHRSQKKTSWKVTFNLYADVLLNLSTFPQAAYDMESTWYPKVRSAAGVALDNRQWWAKTEWNLWCAGTSQTATRDMFVNDIWEFMSNGLNLWPFSDRYVVAKHAPNGHAPVPVGREFALRARPTVGGHFALLALKGANYLGW